MAQPEIFINKFQQGTAENSNIGTGALVGVNTYDKKGIIQLAKANTSITYSGVGFASFPNVPKYIATSGSGTYYMLLTDAGGSAHLYVSTDGLGQVWSDTSTSISNKIAYGLIFFPCVPKTGTLGYYILFAGTHIYYFQDGLSGGVADFGTPITTAMAVEHPTIISPFDGFLYFGNGNFVGKLGYGTNGTGSGGFDPTTATTGYYINVAQLTLPTYYGVTSLSFLLPNYLALGTSGTLPVSGAAANVNAQIADIILWNPNLSTYETPLRLYSRSSQQGMISVGYPGLIQSGVMSIVNRNNTLYVLTAGNFCLYETNGVNFSLVVDLSLRSTIRKNTGLENNQPVFISGYAPAMAIMGNKILIGVSTPYPVGGADPYPTNYGLFPCGVWTVAFSDGGGLGEVSYGINGTATQCEFTTSTGTVTATSGVFQISCIFPIVGNSALIGWVDNTNPSPGAVNFGMDYIQTNNYKTSNGIIESEMFEVGTPLIPVTIGNLQINLVRNLANSQTISVYYRTAFDQDFTLITGYAFSGTFAGDGTTNYYEITNHSIPQTRFIQFKLVMGAYSGAPTYTPQLKNFIIGTPTK